MVSPFFKRSMHMTIQEALEKLDRLKPNQYTKADKLLWLSNLDRMVKIEIIDTHHGNAIALDGYTADTDTNTMLLVPAPYDDVYTHYLIAQVDYYNQDIGKYNNSMTMFESAYKNYAAYYNRAHAIKPRNKFKL